MEESKIISDIHHDAAETLIAQKKVAEVRNADEDSSSYGSSLNEDDRESDKKQEDNLKSAKAKMDEVREDNERLKLTLSKIMKDYHSLKMHFHQIAEKDDPKTSVPETSADEESELVSLSLGRFSGDEKREDKRNSNEKKNQEHCELDGLELGLDCKFHLSSTEDVKKLSPENSSDESKEEENSDTWPPPKSLKTARSGNDEILQQNFKKPRVSIRAICDAQTMNDGCQWRKYGQKIAKGNPCPRAYYRCTASSSCPVRKQVQRCAQDMSILITTYEGTHNHPLPVSAKAMATATSAAAAMLKSGSTTSQPGLGISATSSTSNANLHGFNFTSINNLSPSQPYYFPRASISTSQSHPTIVLDLTASNVSSSYNKFSSTLFSSTPSSSTCLNFSSVPSSSFHCNTPKISWNNEFHNQSGALFNGRNNLGTPYDSLPYLHNNVQTSLENNLTDKIASATKAIARDPTFQSALAEAIKSFVGSAGNNVQQIPGSGGNSAQNVKARENFHLYFPQQSTREGIGCATSYLNKIPQPLNSNMKNLTSFPPSAKSTHLSLAEEGEHVKL